MVVSAVVWGLWSVSGAGARDGCQRGRAEEVATGSAGTAQNMNFWVSTAMGLRQSTRATRLRGRVAGGRGEPQDVKRRV